MAIERSIESNVMGRREEETDTEADAVRPAAATDVEEVAELMLLLVSCGCNGSFMEGGHACKGNSCGVVDLDGEDNVVDGVIDGGDDDDKEVDEEINDAMLGSLLEFLVVEYMEEANAEAFIEVGREVVDESPDDEDDDTDEEAEAEEEERFKGEVAFTVADVTDRCKGEVGGDERESTNADKAEGLVFSLTSE
jgi:predicted  nucleic acid-binding Zn-ribbon protein